MNDIRTVGYIDRNKYCCIAEHITTDEVIITDERIEHIKERRGNDFFEIYEQYFSLVLSEPDYIFQDDRLNTALVCKLIGEGENAINLVVRLAVESDHRGYKNSILTVVKENKKRFAQRLRNNIPIYERN